MEQVEQHNRPPTDSGTCHLHISPGINYHHHVITRISHPSRGTVTLIPSPESPLHAGPKTWEIASKVHERVNIVNQQDVSNGLGPYVAGKFMCHPAGPNSPDILAFMRMYKQLPIAGTQFEKAPIRATQAVKLYEPAELTALKSLEEKGCDVTPPLLAYQFNQQEEDDIVPGGFWGFSISQREEIRLKFREVYQLFGELFVLINAGYLNDITPITTFPFDNVIGALSHIRTGCHIGKIVISLGENDDVQK
ncbi:hypothetical protein N7517_005397 [Penicillium concentricum]|uniref:Uncharacterized protein n=1 Tax=Penicillium concentricum TaxID=293559 RepID=A0A9W9VBJ8_9EURO|nr:uncharacterized protein N7517_005397 [Penicillium concentricum]KAJ5373391.1 hypothetical protein N7517_005397 [Penicillium concentricum]